MCGIVGFSGKHSAAPILLDGLSKLEYRGYDSAGIAVRDGSAEPVVVKAKGRLKILAEKTNDKFEYIDWYFFERTFLGGSLVEIDSDTCSLSIRVDSPQKLYELLVLLDEENLYDDETYCAN